MISLSLWATTFNVSDNLIVSEIDNKIVEHGLLSKQSTFTLNPGKHVIVVYYKDVFEDLDFAENRVVKSKDFVAKFSVTEETHLELTTIPIKNLAQAESFSKSPLLLLTDGNKGEIHIELENINDYRIAQQVNIAVDKAIVEQTSIANNLTTTNISSPSPVKTQSVSNTLIQVNALTMLKYWWQNTSSEERESFKQHIE
jgi:uncharacterized protein YccT (UPF0319 family)